MFYLLVYIYIYWNILVVIIIFNFFFIISNILYSFIVFYKGIVIEEKMASVNSGAGVQTRFQSRHPQALQYFTEGWLLFIHELLFNWLLNSVGLASMLRQWTALELAIHNAWGGSNSREKAQQLNTMIIEMFNKPEKVYKDELVMLLEDVLEVNFNVICEDGSIEEISELIILIDATLLIDLFNDTEYLFGVK